MKIVTMTVEIYCELPDDAYPDPMYLNGSTEDIQSMIRGVDLVNVVGFSTTDVSVKEPA